MKRSSKFKNFFEDFFIPVCRFVERYIREEEAATDIAQEVFVKVYERWGEFETIDHARAFLYTIARNLALDDLKHKKAQDNYIQSFPENNETVEHAFLKEVTRQETFRILYSAIDHLPAQTRQVILYSLEGLSVQEVGDRMGISANTVKTLKKNAYASLRNLLSREYLVFLIVFLEKF